VAAGQLTPLPPTFAATRLALHRLAVYVVSPARRLATGNEIALEAAPGGFATPAADGWGRVEVHGGVLVVDRDGKRHMAPITSLRAAAELAGLEPDVGQAEQFDVPPPGDLDAQLAIDPAAAAVLARWYGLAERTLAAFAAGLPAADEPSPAHLWSEHFDLAIDAGPPERRGAWGFSPGDAAHDEPYAYVSLPPAAVAEDPFFAEQHFAGASLAYAALAAADDPDGAALAFLQRAHERLSR
jgi:hypothetical protein